ncbi:hypothetical protein [Adhaeribacter aquaticus]|uniref:hypothetical protein n=1 Tax=Adhaeribacter aquaticus TaxID=299567 RepID=UPI000406D377|nr:hypothetical protein [Adhaeribacter aquaticus]
MSNKNPSSLDEAISYVLSLTGEEKEKAILRLPIYQEGLDAIYKELDSRQLNFDVVNPSVKKFFIEKTNDVNSYEYVKLSLSVPNEIREALVGLMSQKRKYIEEKGDINYYKIEVNTLLNYLKDNSKDEMETLSYRVELNKIFLKAQYELVSSRKIGPLSIEQVSRIEKNFNEAIFATGIMKTLFKNDLLHLDTLFQKTALDEREALSREVLSHLERVYILNSEKSVRERLGEFKKYLLTYNTVNLNNTLKDKKYIDYRDDNKFSFNCQSKISIIELYKFLREERLISADSLENDFIKMFTGFELENINPIRWIGTETLLAYMLDCLEKMVSIPDFGRRYYIASKCFFKKTPFDIINTQLSRSSNNYKNSKIGKPTNYKLIDDIITRIQSSEL